MLLAASILLTAAMLSADDASRPVVPIAEIRGLAMSEAAESRSVRIRGVVTLVVGDQMPENTLVLQDETAGIWVNLEPPLTVEGLNTGDEIAVEGVTDRGGFAPTVLARSLRRLGTKPLPAPRTVGGIGIDGRLAAELRDGQLEAAKASEATLVTTIDLPPDPSPSVLAGRIAGVMAADAFGKGPGRVTGPKLTSVETRGDTVVLSFTDTKGGLTAKGGELKGFAIAASPMRWVWADARIDGDTLTVSSSAVPEPEGVRYAYEDVTSRGATLCDADGNPANPFRTDTHPSLTDANLDPAAQIRRFNRRTNPAIEDAKLPRVLIIGDSISGHYLERVRLLMEGQANIVGEASMDPEKKSWASVGGRFYRTDTATKGDDLKNFLVESGPWDIVHFNIGIHMFAGAKPGDEKPYAEKLRQVVQTIRDSGAVCLFANSTGTVADDTMPRFPKYLTNCKAFNAAAEEVMKEMGVPVTDIYGMIQPRIKELISGDLIHTNAEADQMMAELIAKRLTETIAALPTKPH